MTGAERQRRYWKRLRARLVGIVPPPPARTHTGGGTRPGTQAGPPGKLIWQRKAHEASGTANDGAEYIVAQVPDTSEFEVNFYDDTSDFRFVGDGFRTMADAERVAETHNIKRLAPPRGG